MNIGPIKAWNARKVRIKALLLSCAFLLGACGTVADFGGNIDTLNAPPNFTRGLLVMSAPTPLYPQRARALGIEGWVMLSFSVDVSGSVIPFSIETVNEQPEGYFEGAALSAVRRMNFENNTNRIVQDVRYVFRFELEEREGLLVEPTEEIATTREAIPTRFITPPYPQFAEEQGLEGHVVVRFAISERGVVEDIEIIESNPPTVFDEEAIRAASRLRFEPQLDAGVPVRAEGYTYRFDWRNPR